MKKPKYKEKSLKTSKGIEIFYNLLGFNNILPQDNFKNSILVFLHGLGGDLDAWNEIREKFFKKGYESLAIDIRGHGISSRPSKNSDYDFKLIASDVEKIIVHEKLKNIVLIGHCFGGMIAQEIAIKNNPQVKKVVLISTSCKPFNIMKKLKISSAILSLAKLFENYISKVHENGRISHRKYIGTGDFNFFRVVNDLKHTSLNSYSHIFSNVHTYDLSKEVNKINADVLVMVGSKDKIFLEKSSKKIQKLISGSKFILIEGADHMVIFNFPNEVINNIYNFIS